MCRNMVEGHGKDQARDGEVLYWGRCRTGEFSFMRRPGNECVAVPPGSLLEFQKLDLPQELKKRLGKGPAELHESRDPRGHGFYDVLFFEDEELPLRELPLGAKVVVHLSPEDIGLEHGCRPLDPEEINEVDEPIFAAFV